MANKQMSNRRRRRSLFKKVKRTFSYFYKTHKRATASSINLLFAVATGLFANMLFKWFEFLTNPASGISFGVAVIIFILSISFLLLFFFFAMYGIEAIKDKVLSLEANDEKYMKQALLSLKELGAKEQTHLTKGIVLMKDKNSAEVYCAEIEKNIQLVIESCYSFFANTFGEVSELVNTRQFEITFFTKSYIDGYLTIIAHENRNHRVPTSISLRETQKDIYSDTLAASVYEKFETTHKPAEMILRENTQLTPEGEKEYTELYTGERKKNKSTIVFPINSSANDLLGIIVITCNEKCFFKNEDKMFWNEIMEVFSVELGYQKMLLDDLVASNSSFDIKPF